MKSNVLYFLMCFEEYIKYIKGVQMLQTYTLGTNYTNITIFASGCLKDNPATEYKNKKFLILEETPTRYIYAPSGVLAGKVGGVVLDEALYEFDGVNTFTRLNINLESIGKRSQYPSFVGQERFKK